MPTLRVGDLLRDHALIEDARREAVAWLDRPESSQALVTYVSATWATRFGLGGIGQERSRGGAEDAEGANSSLTAVAALRSSAQSSRGERGGGGEGDIADLAFSATPRSPREMHLARNAVGLGVSAPRAVL
jgi:hypothetical protein